MMKKKASGRKGREDGIICAQSPVAWASPAERWKKKHRNQGSLRVIQYVRKNVSSRCPQNRQKGKKNDGERAREIEIVN